MKNVVPAEPLDNFPLNEMDPAALSPALTAYDALTLWSLEKNEASRSNDEHTHTHKQTAIDYKSRYNIKNEYLRIKKVLYFPSSFPFLLFDIRQKEEE